MRRALERIHREREAFVELAPRDGIECQTRPVAQLPAGMLPMPLLVDKANGEVLYDWTWRSRHEAAIGGLPSVTPGPLGDAVQDWDHAAVLGQGMSADGAVWVVFTGSDHLIAVARHRSPFQPRPYAISTTLPTADPAVAAAFRAQLHALAQLRVNVRGGDGPALVSDEVVAGLDRIDLGAGEPDFPTPMAKRVERAGQVWKLGADLLNAAFERWQDPSMATDYGCIYSPDGQVPTPGGYGSHVWRDVSLPPQVRRRIEMLKEMPEGPDRVRLRREANRLLLDFLVPSAGVATCLVHGYVAERLIAGAEEVSRTPPCGFEVRDGRNQDDTPFNGISVWYKRPYGATAQSCCILAISYDGKAVWRIEKPTAGPQ